MVDGIAKVLMMVIDELGVIDGLLGLTKRSRHDGRCGEGRGGREKWGDWSGQGEKFQDVLEGRPGYLKVRDETNGSRRKRSESRQASGEPEELPAGQVAEGKKISRFRNGNLRKNAGGERGLNCHYEG
jgi:hypothetical protein